jgi:SPP1 gp7 family putative phage head morphogenesis protein
MNKKGFYYRLKRRQPYRVKMELDRLNSAILAAENPLAPNRLMLYAIYREVMRDAHLLSQTRTITNKILSSDFIIEKAGVEDEELKKLLRRPWLTKYIKYWVEHVWHGHSLVEFCQKVDSNSKLIDKEFDNVVLMPREHVHPWSGQIVIDPNHTKGIPYRDKKLENILMEIGDDDDLGLLLVAAREVIYKNYSRGDWSRHSEKFGMPITIVKTATRDETELDTKAEWAANLGANGWAVLDDNDEVDLIESNRTDAYKIYLEGIKFSDEQISKLITGQTSTSDEKSFVGSAEVHERVLNVYVLSLLLALQDHINFKLIPFLVRNGYPLMDCMFKFSDIVRYYTIPETVQEEPTKEKEGEKKKLSFNFALQSFYKACSCTVKTLSKKLLNFGNVEQLIARAAKNIYNKKLQAGDLDLELWRANVTRLVEAVQEGVGKKYHSINYQDKDHDLMVQLRRNIYAFAAFKNHSNIKDMVDFLQEDGKVVSFSDFKAKAEQIGKIYNVNWLQSEYDTALAQSELAVKWGDIQRDKERLPLLQYNAVNDERTRPAHAALDGVTLPVDDPFWDEFYPPNGWKCRCAVQQLADGETKEPVTIPNDKEIPLSFRNNTGKTGQLYSEEHPYFKRTTKKDKEHILSTVHSFVLEDDEAFQASRSAVNRRSNLPEVLTGDQRAAIYHYTTKAFQDLNLRLRVERLSDSAWAHSQVLEQAIEKLPKYKGDSYRFVAGSKSLIGEFEKAFKEDLKYIEKGFLSSSQNLDFALALLDSSVSSSKALITIIGKNGRDVSKLSKKQAQQEILFNKNTTFKVEQFTRLEDGSYLITLKEV